MTIKGPAEGSIYQAGSQTMKNITLTVPDEIYLAARIWAAQNNTSVSRLVKDFLESIPEESGSELKFPKNFPDPRPPYLL